MLDVTNEPTIDLDQAPSAPAASDPISALAVGQVLRDRYVLHARLGMGGKGSVFKALDRFRATLPEAHQYVALKVLNAAGDRSEQTLANLCLEFHCGQVLSHRNIVNVYELDRDGDVVFFTMELLDGEPLSTVIQRLRPAAMRKSHARQLIQQIGAGLAHAHERGVVHGDLKPRNIFITREGELRILDFGAAHRFTAVKSRSRHVGHAPISGTPAYASCEQLEGRRADPRDDLYALACICYELFAGTHPFGSRPATLARDHHMRLVRPPGLTGRQWRALQKGLSWHRGGRSISVASWTQRLTNGRSQVHLATPLQELTQPNRVQPKIPWRAAALFVVVTLTTAAVLAQLRSTLALKTINSPSPVLSATSNREVTAAVSRQVSSAPTRELSSAPTGEVTIAPTRGPTSAPTGEVTIAPTRELTSAQTGEVGSAQIREFKSAPTRELTSAPTLEVTSTLPNARPATDFVVARASVSVRKEIASGAQAKAAARPIAPEISVEPSQVTSEDHFAEIRLHRNLLQKNSSFTWWTEPATAKPGVDYVPEAVAIQTFPAGFRTARLYVRLLPQSLRSRRSYFYIAIAQPGPPQAPETVIRRQIWLPLSSNLQAQR